MHGAQMPRSPDLLETMNAVCTVGTANLWLVSPSGFRAPRVLFQDSPKAFSPSRSTPGDVVIVSDNDLDPSNPNRAGALSLRTPLAYSQAMSTCAALQETLLRHQRALDLLHSKT